MSTPNSKIFKDRLQKMRSVKSLSQDELAKKIGLPLGTISHFETGNRKPSFDNLRKLADALETSIDYLMGRVDDPKGHYQAKAEAEIFRDFDNMTDDDRDLARSFLKQLADRNKKK